MELDEAVARGARDVLHRLETLDPERLSDAAARAGRPEFQAALAHLHDKDSDPTALTIEGEELARAWAGGGAPVGGLIALCRLWHAALADAWYEWYDGDPAATLGNEVLRTVQRFWFDYFAGLASLLASAYTMEAEALRKARSQRHLHLVQDLLEGRTDTAPGVSYDLSLSHTALVAWGPAAAKTGAWLQEELAHNVLIVAVGSDLVWGWIGGTVDIERLALRRLERRLGTSGASIAFGRDGAGLEGFRRSHAQARATHSIAIMRGDRLALRRPER
jgi:hypothetical protein